MQPSTNVVAATYRKLQIWGLWYFEKMANFLWEVFTYGVSTDYDWVAMSLKVSARQIAKQQLSSLQK